MIKQKVINKKLNLFLIHSHIEDDTWRKQIRVCPNQRMLLIINEIVEKCGFESCRKDLPFQVSSQNFELWFKGKTAIPLVAIEMLLENLKENLGDYYFKEYVEALLPTLNFFKSTTISQRVFLPSIISDDLLYCVGVIIGDGSLPIHFTTKGTRIYPVYICGTNEEYLQGSIPPLMSRVFKINCVPKSREREGKKPLYEWCVSSKPLQRYLNVLFDVPIGKKSGDVRIPEIVRNLPPLERVPLIVGLMDTDWGFEKWHFGTGTKSEQLLEDTIETLMRIDGALTLRKEERLINGKFKTFSTHVPNNNIKQLYNLIAQRYKLKNIEKIKTIRKMMLKAPVV